MTRLIPEQQDIRESTVPTFLPASASTEHGETAAAKTVRTAALRRGKLLFEDTEKNILHQDFKKIGIGFNKIGKAPYGAVTVMDFAKSYTSK